MTHSPKTGQTLVAVTLSLALAGSALGYGKPGATNTNKQQGNNRNTQTNNQQQQQPLPPKQQVTIPNIDTTGLDAAKKDEAAAKAEEKKALNEVNQVHAKLTKGFETKPEVVEATQAASKAKAAYDAVATPIAKSVESSTGYKTQLAAVTLADKHVDEVKAKPDTTPQQRMDAAKAALEAHNALTQMKTEALTADPKVAAAKKDYEAASQALAKVRQDLDATVKDDPDLVAAKKALDDAKAKTKEADDKVAAATKDIADQKAKRQAALDQQKKIDREYAAAKNKANKTR